MKASARYRKRVRKRKSLIIRLIPWAFVSIVTVLLLIVGLFLYFSKDLPQLTPLKDYNPNITTKVFDDEGDLAAEFYVEKREIVPLEKIPTNLIKAFMATEDSHFFKHKGVDYLAILRALLKNIRAGALVQGGSTITQQVVKSILLTPEKSLSRKIKEAILAYKIEKNFSKMDILYLYLNQIYLGDGCYGVQAAALNYFGKKVEDLNLAECALLAGLAKAPSRYSPFRDPALAKKRQGYVLDRMLKEGFIDVGEYEAAKAAALSFNYKGKKRNRIGAYFIEHVRQYIEKKYGVDALYKGGLRVYTTLNQFMQRKSEKAVIKGLRELDKRQGYRGPVMHLSQDQWEGFINVFKRRRWKKPLKKGKIYYGLATDMNDSHVIVHMGSKMGILPLEDMEWARSPDSSVPYGWKRITRPSQALKLGDVIEVKVKERDKRGNLLLSLEQKPLVQGALLALEVNTGYVKAMMGGRAFSESQFNRVTQSRRQPGSAFKPILYAAAIDRGFTPASIIVDAPIILRGADGKEWKPRNYEDEFKGPVTLRYALAHSRNIVSIKLLQRIGVNYCIKYARKLGIKSHLDRYLSLALGSSGVSLWELTNAYGVFASQGKRFEPIFIKKILDKEGKVLEENLPRWQQVISPETAYIMTDLLIGVVQEGTGRKVRELGRPAAGKTGTTNDHIDAWFIGYTPGLVAGVWVGFDDLKPLGKFETGARAASPIWLYFMSKAIKNKPIETFPIPDKIVFTKIDANTGQSATHQSQNIIFQPFKEGTIPEESFQEKRSEEEKNFFKLDLSKQ